MSISFLAFRRREVGKKSSSMFILLMIAIFITDSVQREHNTYPVLSEALRFIDSAQNSLCHQEHKTNSSIQYAVVTIGTGGGFAAQVRIFGFCCMNIYILYRNPYIRKTIKHLRNVLLHVS